jgi:hypothetical protein
MMMKKQDTIPTPRDRRRHRPIKFVLIFLCSIVCVLLLLVLTRPLQNEFSRHRQARHVALEIQDLGGRVSWNPKMEIIETIVRDKALSRITDVHFTNPSFPDEKWLILKGLPQRFGLQVEGLQFTDASLEYLKDVKLLNYLVLNETSVTDQGVADLIKSLPHITVVYGYPGDPNFRKIQGNRIEIPSQHD